MPTIHAFDVADFDHGGNTTEMKMADTQKEQACPITGNTKNNTKGCYEVATTDRYVPSCFRIEIVEIFQQSSVVTAGEYSLFAINSSKLYATAPPEKPTPGRYAALVGILKITN